MNLDIITETAEAAKAKYLEYREGLKKRNDPAYKDLKQLYRQLYLGKKIIDIFDVIQKGGVHENFHPKLAVTKADAKTVECRYEQNGNIVFRNNGQWSKKTQWIDLKNCLPEYKMNNAWDSLNLKAPVPIIPPSVLPAKLTDDYYILWEVDKWQMVPPVDPWLLKRINERMFVAVAGWNLTALERSAMASKIK